jgi:hypothetical protein
MLVYVARRRGIREFRENLASILEPKTTVTNTRHGTTAEEPIADFEKARKERRVSRERS